MDLDFVAKLRQSGLEPDANRLSVGVPRAGDPLAQEDAPGMLVTDGRTQSIITAKPIARLFVGSRQPPSLREVPPEEYRPFFRALEWAAADACLARGRPEPDAEFERLYRLLRRCPDGVDRNPIFGCLQRAAQLYLSLNDVSQAEFEAVMDRLSKSARVFSTHPGSTNYFQHALAPLVEG